MAKSDKKLTSSEKSPSKRKGKQVIKAPQAAIDNIELQVMNAFDSSKFFLPQQIQHSVVAAEKVTDILHDIPLEDVETALVNRSNNKLNKVSLDDVILKESISTQKFTEFDKAVIESVIAQMMGGNTVMTASMIYRTMIGKSGSEYIHQAQRRSVDISMEKCMSTLLNIDLDVPAGPNGEETSAKFTGNVIPAERIEVNVAGNRTSAYQIVKTPALYRICTRTDGLTLTPLNFLSVEMNYTKRNLCILNYLQRRVAPFMYPAVNASPYAKLPALNSGEKEKAITIDYEELYAIAREEDGQQSDLTFTVKNRVRETAHLIFDAWCKGGYLEDWQEIKRNGRSLLGAMLILSENPPQLTDPVI